MQEMVGSFFVAAVITIFGLASLYAAYKLSKE